ncbi:monocarboxylate permease [Suhomyces tanzawaensis NRRL Y-17324]|uniref:Monocarboxylate permease n=1 Tax=Suhomyces tanzawaensis NRRL Y-17324 TaxID=984487 RepID=A0A1E4SJQ7_9ASCO|nr:monocarboxylate permease [Suhomyces tanzawaensis NRRL Y-17324]ODV79745.1 monocarboxylate permease [Suhomyces tanzawaensis NRRL Y-17324]
MYGSEPNPEAFPDGGMAANVVLLGSFMGLIADFGIGNSMGAVQTYITTHQLKHVEPTTISWIFSIHLGVMYFGGVFFGELFDLLGAKPPLVAGMLTIGAGLLLTAESTSVGQFILSFSILTALGTSISMSPLIGALSHWFLRKRAMACLIATIGGLVGASVFPVMLQRLYQEAGFKWAMRILALVCMGCMLVAVVLVKERAESDAGETGEHPPARFSVVASARKTARFFRNALDLSILRDSRFVLLTVAVALAELVLVSTMTYFSFYALNKNVLEQSAYLLLTVVNVSGIPSRLAAGILADAYGRFNVMLVSSVITTVLVFGVWLPVGARVAGLFVFATTFGMSTSAVISLIPACTGQICAADRFGKVYGTLYFLLGFLTVAGMAVASVVIGKGSGASLRNFVLYEGVVSATSVVMWVAARYSAVGWRVCKF